MIKKGLNFLIQTKGFIQFLNVFIQFLLNYMIINSIISMIVFDSYLFYHGFKLSKEKSYL